jgi:hypothetical protein
MVRATYKYTNWEKKGNKEENKPQYGIHKYTTNSMKLVIVQAIKKLLNFLAIRRSFARTYPCILFGSQLIQSTFFVSDQFQIILSLRPMPAK